MYHFAILLAHLHRKFYGHQSPFAIPPLEFKSASILSANEMNRLILDGCALASTSKSFKHLRSFSFSSITARLRSMFIASIVSANQKERGWEETNSASATNSATLTGKQCIFPTNRAACSSRGTGPPRRSDGPPTSRSGPCGSPRCGHLR